MPSVPSQRIASHRIALNQTRRNTSRDGNNEQPRVRRRQDREHGSDTPAGRVGLRARNKRTPPLRDESRSIDRCTDRGGRRTEKLVLVTHSSSRSNTQYNIAFVLSRTTGWHVPVPGATFRLNFTSPGHDFKKNITGHRVGPTVGGCLYLR
mmetsp:Transcript_14466/g.33302  ORF Transcript_14466/g.33302 Transcript_14466/m.33302 type:complete len:151 (-) Transcript_14466:40-492(-)